MAETSKRRTTTLTALTALALSASTVCAADLPPASIDILGWPRMTSKAFGCLMERTFGHRDPKFNCDLKDVEPGDPCVKTREYYAGPEFPQALATRIHPLATDVRLDFEHGDLREVGITLTGKFSESEVLKAFGLPRDETRPENIVYVSVQSCSLVATCLLLQGFDHQGAGDIDCSDKPRRR